MPIGRIIGRAIRKAVKKKVARKTLKKTAKIKPVKRSVKRKTTKKSKGKKTAKREFAKTPSQKKAFKEALTIHKRLKSGQSINDPRKKVVTEVKNKRQADKDRVRKGKGVSSDTKVLGAATGITGAAATDKKNRKTFKKGAKALSTKKGRKKVGKQVKKRIKKYFGG